MENQDKLFEQFKALSSGGEPESFPAMEKVWSRVEDKLDYESARRSARIWKIIAIAASIALVATIGSQFIDIGGNSPTKIQTSVVTAPDQPPTMTPEATVSAPSGFVKPSPPRRPIRSAILATPVIAEISEPVTAEMDFVEQTNTDDHRLAASDQQSETIQPQPLQTISGSVSDDMGVLPGANIVVMGTTRATHTDTEGKYSIEAKEGEKLLFSFGTKDMVATVGDANEINAKLPDSPTLSSSVNAAGMKASKSSKPSKRPRVVRTPAASQIGRVEREETPQIRANVEFSSNAPTLYIIDGKPATEAQFKLLKTEDIASMKLLSQSEARAVYGDKAVNGAMVVSKKAARNAQATLWFDEGSTENAFENPEAAPLSTFRLSVETNAYADIRNYINQGKKVPKNIVRIEEMINYFQYDYPQPEGAHPVVVHTEYSSCPWNSKHKLLKIGLQAQNVPWPIAKDAKIQIEFNPTIVKGYRLIGYEKFQLRPEDFKPADKTGGIRGGHAVTALYEVIPNGVESQYFSIRDDIVYTKINTGTKFRGELANIRFRYERPDNGKTAELVKWVPNRAELLQNSSNDFRFCAAVAWFGLKLRQSELIGNRSYADLLKLAKSSVSAESDGSRGEFVRLVEAVK